MIQLHSAKNVPLTIVNTTMQIRALHVKKWESDSSWIASGCRAFVLKGRQSYNT